MEEQCKPTRWGLWLVVGLVLLVAYPLSMGPVSWLIDHKYLNYDTGWRPYQPIFDLTRDSER